jgi:hypothetical protein
MEKFNKEKAVQEFFDAVKLYIDKRLEVDSKAKEKEMKKYINKRLKEVSQ